MKKSTAYLLLAGLLIVAANFSAEAQSIKLTKQVIGTAGMVGQTNSEGLRMSGIAGQAAIGKVTTTSEFEGTIYDIYQGFWVPDGQEATGVEEPISYSDDLLNYPNPFSYQTTVKYSLPGYAMVQLRIYDLVGNVVKTLVNTSQGEGVHEIAWDGRDEAGNKLTSGSYIYELNVRPGGFAGGGDFRPYTVRNVMVIVK
ncbi:MAG: FlgD immunoglobulin-like domain containing protein [Candidatus Kapaibacterium sp.]